ncbi:hypothetical protein CYY_005272 [Polysphondylium violaceum]|uniref:EamA domain-containing protein n=1 Tax=Polysphondylium violaceum TaxID=133409 RepID=A0A8J4V704_9MYCE|nr:hypothetical protein CYY_005272 [Polysphondylium violaceum]
MEDSTTNSGGALIEDTSYDVHEERNHFTPLRGSDSNSNLNNNDDSSNDSSTSTSTLDIFLANGEIDDDEDDDDDETNTMTNTILEREDQDDDINNNSNNDNQQILQQPGKTSKHVPIWVYAVLVFAIFSMSSAATALKSLKDVPPILKASYRLQSTSFLLFVGFMYDLNSVYQWVDLYKLWIRFLSFLPLHLLPQSLNPNHKHKSGNKYTKQIDNSTTTAVEQGEGGIELELQQQQQQQQQQQIDLSSNKEKEEREKREYIKNNLLKPSSIAWLVGTGVILGIHFALWVMSLDETSLPHALLFVTSTPIMVVILMLIMRKPISKGEIVGCILGFFGLIVTLLDSLSPHVRSDGHSESIGSSSGISEGNGEQPTVYGDILALLGAVCVVFYLFAGAKLRTWLPLFLYAFPVTFITSVLLSISSKIFETTPIPKPGQSFGVFGWMSPDFVLLGLYLGLFPGCAGHTGMNLVIAYLEPVVISVGLLVEPPLGSLMGWVVGVSSLPGLYTFIGGIVILSGCTIVTVAANKRNKMQKEKEIQKEKEKELEQVSLHSTQSDL